ncbi:SusC/RagA family TonB-linked outer membrane protein [Agriterribacter sp.]|uniref:SusC/RagA family TonB-linked outer membrane protein n=1 Tax=Agriterribacter sp. TaxID=2821509 RepID=UPI002D19A199|nr:SusC/RagA family TonB-linked outer membrane protein [Agriterribacter sp.]HTN05913.1 SusC/RagA family TonB-linked outer membrane protein [Agriterribacter sp.]
MKVSFIITTLLSLQMALLANAQKEISLSVKKESLRNVLTLIEKHSGYRFLYTDDPVFENSRVTLKVQKAAFEEVMSRVLAGTGLGYTVNNNELVVLSFAPFTSLAVITGRVTDEEGNPLSGVTVQVKGANTSTVTNANGEFSIDAGSNAILVFSSVGFTAREIAAGSNAVTNVRLETDKKGLSEVVVTALGISREKKSLGYSTQKVDGAQLNESPSSNFVNGIAGKVAGVQISSSGAVGSSSKMVIRGESSLSMQNNQPLFVIDGVPIGNDGVSNTNANADYGNSAAEVNPADIESMNVLKGPAAAALYGSRAANGAIVITTKKGSARKGMDVNFNTYYFAQEVAWLPKFQNQFGQGRDGNYEGSNFGASWSIYPDGIRDSYDESWGPRLDNGTLEKQVTSPTTGGFRGGDVAINNRGDVIATPWVSQPNNIKDFFNTGSKFYNNLALSGGNDKGTYRLSLSSLNDKGVIPNNNLDRYQVSLNSSYKLTSKLTSSINFNYMKQKSDNRPDNGYGRNTFMYIFTWMTRQVDINALRNYWQAGYEGLRQFQFNYGENHNNPFFLMYENTKAQDKDRLYGNIALEYAFTDKLKLKVRTADDLYYDFRPMKWAVSNADNPLGGYQETRIKYEERNTDLLLTYNSAAAADDIGYTISAGANRFDQNGNNNTVTNKGLAVPGIYNLGNTSQLLEAGNSIYKKRINSVYGMVNLNYKGLVYLDLTARNDWSSTLPSNNNSYFYPSVGLNTNIRDILGLPAAVSQAQLRFSWAQMGNDAPLYSLINTYGYGSPWGNNYSLVGNSTLMNANLKPEISSTYEVGASLGFFNNRVAVDVTYYDIRTKNQVLGLPMVQSSGQLFRVINAGEIKNSGVEVMLSATPVSTPGGFKWNFSINWSHNVGKVISLDTEVDKIVQANPGEDASIQARVGEKMGAIWGPGYQRVPDGPLKGQVIIGSNGRAKATTEEMYLGNVNPDWIGGFYNQVTYKNFHLNFLFAGQVGGKFISRFYNKAAGSGQLIESAMGRGERAPGTEYDAPYYAKGAALMPDGSYQPNSTGDGGKLDAGVYGTDIRSMVKGQLDHISEAQLFSTTYFKLRELSVGYSLPYKLISSTFIKNAKISLTGRNLLLFRPESNHHFDPEVAIATTGNGLVPGFENMSVPSMREVGVSLNLNF